MDTKNIIVIPKYTPAAVALQSAFLLGEANHNAASGRLVMIDSDVYKKDNQQWKMTDVFLENTHGDHVASLRLAIPERILEVASGAIDIFSASRYLSYCYIEYLSVTSYQAEQFGLIKCEAKDSSGNPQVRAKATGKTYNVIPSVSFHHKWVLVVLRGSLFYASDISNAIKKLWENNLTSTPDFITRALMDKLDEMALMLYGYFSGAVLVDTHSGAVHHLFGKPTFQDIPVPRSVPRMCFTTDDTSVGILVL